MGWYDTAQICVNGHVINMYAKSSPEFSRKFCKDCGAATITQCPSCNSDIQGEYHAEGVIGFFSEPIAPAYCHNCGSPYPWTEAKLQAAKKLALELEDISDEDKQVLADSLDDIGRDTPKTQLAATRFKKIMQKTKDQAGSALRDIAVDIASEAAKKILMP